MTIAPDVSDAELKALARRIDRPVVLVGMMGVGKSTVGRKLALLLGLPFTDADDEIEKSAQMPIAEIFERFGEDYFRDGERRVIARMLEAGPGVLATGGGAFVQPQTRALILDRGIVVWLDSDVDTLVERTGRKDTRPLLRQGNPRETIERLKREREPAYAHAHIKVVSSPGPHQATVMEIAKALDTWL